MFSAFGSEVTLVELLPTVIPAEDEDMGKTLARSFTRRGIRVQTGRTVSAITQAGARKGAPPALQVTVADPDGQNPEQVETDVILVGWAGGPTPGRWTSSAPGWRPTSGVETDQRGWVQVDDQLRTNVPGV
jgi:dihydrolipoamide dehydrogenase